jgi:pyrroline-5-carboxylate reductase
MVEKLSAGFVGCGMMASAMMDGVIAKHVVEGPASIICSDIWQPSLDAAASKGITTAASNEEEVCTEAKYVVILAVKPFVVEECCKDIVKVPSTALIISIAAGITLETLQNSCLAEELCV